MNLEDHLGDILAKARLATGLSLEAVAEVAGLDRADYRRLEEEGESALPPNLDALGARLKLDAARLRGIGAGWLPAVVELDHWREVRRFQSEGGGLRVNAYLIWDEVTREAALFDTGFDAADILKTVTTEELELLHIFITHGHPDHRAALPEILQDHPRAKLHSSAADAPLHQRNRPNDFIHLGSLRITNRATPGHSDDGASYVVGNWPEDAPSAVFVGDALFAGSMGRAGDRLDQARDVVREQILSLPDNTLVCPGHGPLTTVGEERLHNPFLG